MFWLGVAAPLPGRPDLMAEAAACIPALRQVFDELDAKDTTEADGKETR